MQKIFQENLFFSPKEALKQEKKGMLSQKHFKILDRHNQSLSDFMKITR